MTRYIYRCTLILVLGVLAAAAQAGNSRDSYPRMEIDPNLGYLGDANYSGTLRYWKDDSALAESQELAGMGDESWRLNWKHLDLDRGGLHPGYIAVDEGEELIRLWERREPGFTACLSAGSRGLDTVALEHPRFDPLLKRIMTVEARVEHCAEKVLWEKFRQGSPVNTKISAYLKSLGAGSPIHLDLSYPPMRNAYRRGENLFYKKVGQLNFACASCHTPSGVMGHKLRGETPTTPFADVAHYPTYRSKIGEMESLHTRFKRCLKQMRAQPLPEGDPVYVDLEIFYTVLSNGYPLSVPSMR